MKNLIFHILLFLTFVTYMNGQTVTKLTNTDIIEMVAAGIPESVIITKIKSMPCSFATEVKDLKSLTEAKTPAAVISAMIEQATRPADVRVDPLSDQPKINVPPGKTVVYLYAQSPPATVGTVKKAVMLDGKIIAEIQGQQYFIVVTNPGKHSFSFETTRRGGIERDFKAGDVLYLRVNWQLGMLWVHINGVDVVDPTSGAFEVKQLHPVSLKNIRDKDQVVLELK